MSPHLDLGLVPLDATGFWAAFWPTIVGTLIGIILGIPVALWLTRITTRAADKRARERDRVLLAEVIELLVETLEGHLPLLRAAAVRSDDRFETIAEIDTASWEGVRSDAFRLLRSPRIRGRLGSYFEHVGRLTIAHQLRTERILGRLGVGQFGDPGPTEAGIHRTLRAQAQHLVDRAESLIDELKSISS